MANGELNEQQQYNQQSAEHAARIGNVNTTTPFGAVRYYGTPGYPDYHRVETINPALQTALNWQQQAQALGANQGYDRIHAFNALRGPINVAGLGPMGRALSPTDLPGIWDGFGQPGPAVGPKPIYSGPPGVTSAARPGLPLPSIMAEGVHSRDGVVPRGQPDPGNRVRERFQSGRVIEDHPSGAPVSAPAAGSGVDLIGAVEQATFDRGRALLDPVYQQQEDRMRTRLANQGLDPNSVAGQRAIGNLARQRQQDMNDLSMRSVAAGRGEHARLFGQGTSAPMDGSGTRRTSVAFRAVSGRLAPRASRSFPVPAASAGRAL